jgi:hypothetical protein
MPDDIGHNIFIAFFLLLPPHLLNVVIRMFGPMGNFGDSVLGHLVYIIRKTRSVGQSQSSFPTMEAHGPSFSFSDLSQVEEVCNNTTNIPAHARKLLTGLPTGFSASGLRP